MKIKYEIKGLVFVVVIPEKFKNWVLAKMREDEAPGPELDEAVSKVKTILDSDDDFVEGLTKIKAVLQACIDNR